MFEFYRVAACVPYVTVADVETNTSEILSYINKNTDADFIVFPELSLTGYTCADLFFNNGLIDSVKSAIAQIVSASKDIDSIIMIGAPLIIYGKLYDCAVVVNKGIVKGVQVKTNLLNSYSNYEKRWFSAPCELTESYISSEDIGLGDDYAIPVGNDIIFSTSDGVKFSVEIGDDAFVPVSQSAKLCLGGAEMIFNLAASDEIVTKRSCRREHIKQLSCLLHCVYVYVSAGEGESTTDCVYSGHSLVCENGVLISENGKIADGNYCLKTDVDLGIVKAERLKDKSFIDFDILTLKSFREISVKHQSVCDASLLKLNKLPFIPEIKKDRLEYCLDIFNIQVAGLKKRIRQVRGKMVLGVSGGLDSTLTLLVCVETARQLGLPADSVIGLTLPCFGTTKRTRTNAWELMNTLGVRAMEIDIKEACTQHCHDIGHPDDLFNTTYENVQARERMQVLMDFACKEGGLVIGTGDLSELALGWCTYNADHMSMYGTNAGVPKTLIRWIISALIESGYFTESKDVLLDILDTPISPELLPPDEKGNIAQQTEDIIGPYALHDFFLYYTLKYCYSPTKIYYLAVKAFINDFDNKTVLKWLEVFCRRFFTQQFKRSCMPDGAKVGSISLSPRSDYKMPSDASYNIWIKEIENLKNKDALI